MSHTSLNKDKIKFLLLEGVHQTALDTLERDGYTNIVQHPKALPEAELISAIAKMTPAERARFVAMLTGESPADDEPEVDHDGGTC